MTLCARIIVHPHGHSQETQLIPILVSIHTINKIVVIENTNTIHNILTVQIGTIHYLYWPMILPIFQVSSHKGKIVEIHVTC